MEKMHRADDLGAWGVVKSIQGKTEFTGSIGFRGSVRSVQSSKVLSEEKKISIGFVLSCGLLSQGH